MKLHFEDIKDIPEFKTLVLKFPTILNKIKNVKTLKMSNAKC